VRIAVKTKIVIFRVQKILQKECVTIDFKG